MTDQPDRALSIWLLAQIATDEAAAREADAHPPQLAHEVEFGSPGWYATDTSIGDEVVALSRERALAECGAKRAIIESGRELDSCEAAANEGQLCSVWETTLRALAAVYADRPGYESAWRS